MSYNQVKELRKSGRLDEATAMAREDIARCRDKWSCNALFWCLYDNAKNLGNDELLSTVEEMRTLLQDIGTDDVTSKCMQRVESMLIPHRSDIFQAAENAKQPQLAHNSYETVLSIYNKKELDKSFYENFGWIIYRALHADNSENVECRKTMLDIYLELGLNRSSLLHSKILDEALRIEKESPQQFMFTEFIAKWGLSNLSDDDWARSVSDDNTIRLSRVEKLIYRYTQEVNSTQNIVPGDDFIKVLDRAIDVWPKDDKLLRCKAIILRQTGNINEAISVYKNCIILTGGTQFYLWNDLSALADDIDLKIGCLSKALMLQTPEQYIGKIRLQMAELLSSKGLYGNAKYELEKIQRTYTEQGWRVPTQVYNLDSSMPVDTLSLDNSKLYKNWSLKADEFLYAQFPSIQMVKVAQKESMVERVGKRPKHVVKWTLIDKHGQIFGVNPGRFHLSTHDNGSCFDVKVENQQIVFMSAIVPESVEWRKPVSGSVSLRSSRDGKLHGRVADCYIPAGMLHNVSEGTEVIGVAILQDKGWRLVSMQPIHG